VLFENRGDGRFRDRSAHSGLGYVGHSSAPVFFDYDGDGLLDVLLTNVGVYTGDERGEGGYYVGVADAFQGHLLPERTERTRLYRNLGELRFADVTEEVGLVDDGWTGDAAFFDADGDRDADLYLLNMQGDDHFWRNDGGRFVEATGAHFPKTPWGTMGVKAFDYDNDGDQDLLLTDMHSDMSEEVGPEREHLKSRMQWSEETLQGGEDNVFGNAFFRNLGGGKFEEVSDRLGLENYWPWGVSVADVNADGWEDVLITSGMNFPFRYGLNSLALNDRGERFVSVELALGVEPRAEAKTDWFELDCGGRDRDHRMCEERDGRYRIRGNRGSRSAVIFDLDRDGDLDIVTAELNSEPQVLVSDLATRRDVRFLALRLVGTKSNRDGLGARVRVVTGERVLPRTHDGKSGYLSQSALPLYVGLGDAATVDRVEIEWPSGIRQIIPGPLETNVLLEVVETPEPVETDDSGHR
jgi:hypothetical protein